MKINIGKFLEIITRNILLNFIKNLDLKNKIYNY